MITLAADYMGHVSGGWEYVYAAWGITLAGIVGYGSWLYSRRKKES